MQVLSESEAIKNLKSLLDSVVENNGYTIITRCDGKNAVVMSQDDFNSLMETVHLLKSPANVAHLKQSIEQYRSGKPKIKKH